MSDNVEITLTLKDLSSGALERIKGQITALGASSEQAGKKISDSFTKASTESRSQFDKLFQTWSRAAGQAAIIMGAVNHAMAGYANAQAAANAERDKIDAKQTNAKNQAERVAENEKAGLKHSLERNAMDERNAKVRELHGMSKAEQADSTAGRLHLAGLSDEQVSQYMAKRGPMTTDEHAQVQLFAESVGRQGLSPEETMKRLESMTAATSKFGHVAGFNDRLALLSQRKGLAGREDLGDIVMGSLLKTTRMSKEDEAAFLEKSSDSSLIGLKPDRGGKGSGSMDGPGFHWRAQFAYPDTIAWADNEDGRKRREALRAAKLAAENNVPQEDMPDFVPKPDIPDLQDKKDARIDMATLAKEIGKEMAGVLSAAVVLGLTQGLAGKFATTAAVTAGEVATGAAVGATVQQAAGATQGPGMLGRVGGAVRAGVSAIPGKGFTVAALAAAAAAVGAYLLWPEDGVGPSQEPTTDALKDQADTRTRKTWGERMALGPGGGDALLVPGDTKALVAELQKHTDYLKTIADQQTKIPDAPKASP